jgi:hypothetical protein
MAAFALKPGKIAVQHKWLVHANAFAYLYVSHWQRLLADF